MYFRTTAIAVVAVLTAGAAQAGFEICNETSDVQSVSIGYKGAEDWTSEGWWNIDPGDCATVLSGDLEQRYIYYRAEVDAGEFSGGGYYFCTTPEEYTIVGDTECSARGYDEEDFAEVDTGETATHHVLTLTQAEMETVQSGDDLGLHFCNETSESQSIAVGYEGPDGWMSEGWWNVQSGDCLNPLGGALRNRYYYYRAEVRGGEFPQGEYTFCTTSEAFEIVGDTECEERGYLTEMFAEIDTGPDATGYTFTITDASGGAVPDPNADPGGLRFCNEGDLVQSVAIGYEGSDGWTSEGWWNVQPGTCENAIFGDLSKRYYYYLAEEDGAPFPSGEGYEFCTISDVFTIVGDTECEERGYETGDFAEIDIGVGNTSYTLTLTGSGVPHDDIGDEVADGLEFCNDTDTTQSVSVGYQGAEDWTSEGWWNVDPGECATVLGGPLGNQYYYYRAEVDAGGFNGDGYTFCTTSEAYTIVGDTGCEARGYETEDFAEIDIGSEAASYVFSITDATGGLREAPDDAQQSTDDLGRTPAGFTICNETDHTQELAFGYDGAEDWTSEGWWIIDPGDCVSPTLDGVNRRYLYYRAEIDGGEFVGQNYFFCTSPEIFTIVGDAECEARGYDREDFHEIDTGGDTGEYTFTLVNAEDLAPEPEPMAVEEDPMPEPEPEPEPEPVEPILPPVEDPMPVEEEDTPRRGGSRV